MKATHPSIRVTIGHQPPQADAPEAFASASPELHQAFTPPIDIHESPDGLTLEADLPECDGVQPVHPAARTTFLACTGAN